MSLIEVKDDDGVVENLLHDLPFWVGLLAVHVVVRKCERHDHDWCDDPPSCDEMFEHLASIVETVEDSYKK